MTDELTPGEFTLPRTGEFAPAGALPAAVDKDAPAAGLPTARGVFANLVKGDGDITGLVAYSIYKQNKLDWLHAFGSSQGRLPNEAELTSYLCGEATPRRLATYRHLADATLAGRQPRTVEQAHSNDRPAPFRPIPEMAPDDGGRPGLLERSGLTIGQVAVYALIAVIFVVGVVLALRFTANPPR